MAVVAIAIIAVFFAQRFLSPKHSLTEVTLPNAPGKKAVAVMYFDNQSGQRELDWLREGLADMLITNLSRSPKLNLLSRQQLYALLERIGHETAEPIRLEEARYREMFVWLSQSLKPVSKSVPGSELELPTPGAWGRVES